MEITVRPLHPLFVGEVRGIDAGRLLPRNPTEHATRREFVYRHDWRKGDLGIWDNRCPLHRGRNFDESRVRDLRRVTVRDVGSTLEEAA
jgi:alpha-ketoglutarate-dependent 2,4-dichlorophenoxyacetate dioxygenase